MDRINKYELINTLVKKMGLNAYEANMLEHDINNLRGAEWLDQVEELGDSELTGAFKEVAGIKEKEDYDDEFGYEEI